VQVSVDPNHLNQKIGEYARHEHDGDNSE